ncbi:GFA family protein, partial [Aeromonas veronii]|uniref:GFA family protein n=1 Tax=Aeromonas veronii TaxID=654 RepID=UPI003D2281B1
MLTAPFAADFCHCRDCQRTTGAPVGAWMDFHAEQVQWLCGKPTEYASSDFIRRGFCAECGPCCTIPKQDSSLSGADFAQLTCCRT